jgi:hypothetical protein
MHALQTDAQVASRFEPLLIPRWTATDAFRAFIVAYGRLLPLRKAASFREPEDLKFLTKLPAKALIDRILSPREQLSVPRRAVIECKRWDSADLDMYCWGEGVASSTP